MHRCEWPDKKGSFHFNSDFSGDVIVAIEGRQDVLIPGEAMEWFLATMINYKLGDVSEDITIAVMKRLKGAK